MCLGTRYFAIPVAGSLIQPRICSAEQILGWMRDPATGMASYLVPKHIEFRRSLPPTMDREPETAAVLGRPTHLPPGPLPGVYRRGTAERDNDLRQTAL